MEDKTQLNADQSINDQQNSPENQDLEVGQPENNTTEESTDSTETSELIRLEENQDLEVLDVRTEEVLTENPTLEEPQPIIMEPEPAMVTELGEVSAQDSVQVQQAEPIMESAEVEELNIESAEVEEPTVESEQPVEPIMESEKVEDVVVEATAIDVVDSLTREKEVVLAESTEVEDILPDLAQTVDLASSEIIPELHKVDASEHEPDVTLMPSEEMSEQVEVKEEVYAALTEEPISESQEDEVEEGSEEGSDDELIDDPLETEEKYQTLVREELVEAMEEAVSHDDFSKYKRRISLIRVAFLNKTREEKSLRFEKFIEEGGEKEAYSDTPDALEERFREAFAKYKDKKANWEIGQEKIRQVNLVEKQQILDQLKELINSEESLKKTYDEFRELQDKWSQIGMVPRTENNNLWQNYHFLVEKFFDKVKINRELRDLDLKRNLESKITLCEKVEELLLESSVDRSFRLLQQYHREWKEIGPVPMDKKEEVWERFKRTSDLINDKRREYYDQRQEEMENNLLAKKELCEQAEAIGSSEMNSIRHWQDNTDKINELLKIWKTIGPAPRAQNDTIWTRFRNIMEAFFAAKKDYFDKLKDEQLNNYNMKLDLCVQAESLKYSVDWRKTSQELINLQKRWRDIGPVPRKHSDKIWKRFRAACDDFFAAKSAHFSGIHGQESENLQKKEDLIKGLEAYTFTDDKTENLDILKGFQRDWMEIGHVPMADKDRLQKTFRELIDRKLKELNISSLDMTKSSYRTRIDSMKDTRDGGKMISRERSQLQNKISALQEEINLWENNLGFFAESKKAQILKEEFSRKISKAKQEVALLEAKVKMLREME